MSADFPSGDVLRPQGRVEIRYGPPPDDEMRLARVIHENGPPSMREGANPGEYGAWAHRIAQAILADEEHHAAAPSVPAGPQVGDIVVYIGDNRNLSWSRRRDERAEFIVTQVVDEGSIVHAVELHLPEHPKWRELDHIIAGAEVLRLVRRASYTEVPS